ncbi:MAG: U32 family peptidase [Candidatus Omnitrophica bacterium]|nr:U32 family peptidase [Candidatus Omnitrophota bacterium]
MNETRLSVATNFDNDFLDEIAAYPVEDVYGKLTNDLVGGGRASYTTQGVSANALRSHIHHAHKKKIKFTYLLNSACLGNREWSKKGITSIHKLLDRLTDLKVDSLTVSIPYLAEIIKKQYPHFFLKVGIFANIDSPERARFWQEMGADMLTLESFSINRNFTVLEQIRKAVSCRLQLITNFSCLSRCPMQPYHMAGLSHGSTAGEKNPFVDYCALKCSYQILKDPSLIIRSQWIRPEDLSRYEDMGYHDFKLLERNAPTDLMIQRVKAYAERSSPSNLLDLIQQYGFREETAKDFGWQIKYFFSFLKSNAGCRDMISLLKKMGMLYPLKSKPVSLDSAEIPGDFLTKMVGAECSVSGNCSGCGYCRSVAESTYKVENAYKEECLKLYERVFDQLCSR